MLNPINIYKTIDGKLKTVFNKGYEFHMETDSAFDTMEIIKTFNDEKTVVYVHFKEYVKRITVEYADTLEQWLIDLLYKSEDKNASSAM